MAYFYIAFAVIRYSALEVIIPIVTASCHTKISRNLVDDICSPIIGCGVIIGTTHKKYTNPSIVIKKQV